MEPEKSNHSQTAGIRGDELFACSFWAKTTVEGLPGISVLDHCLNVGCVAELLGHYLPEGVRRLLPEGAVTLAALHDIGKITLGFQAKCPAWLSACKLDARTRAQASLSVSDHALVSQVFLQKLLKPHKAHLWAAAVGSHHGRPKGRSANLNGKIEVGSEWAETCRQRVATEIIKAFGPLPTQPPEKRLEPTCSDLWLLAGLITVADWIGSNEDFFSPVHGQPVSETRLKAKKALAQIGWPGSSLRPVPFHEAFPFTANPLQQTVIQAAAKPGLLIVEGPMGCGKTEAALAAAQQLIAAGHHQGLYFALPTQVTSNRIHLRIAEFLDHTLTGAAHLRLAHAHAWLEHAFDLHLRPAHRKSLKDDQDDPQDDVREARSWFASSKQALIAPYGVGTIDQALQGVVTVKHFFVRRFALAGKVVVLDEVHSYDVYTGTLITALVRELLHLGCTVIILSATLTAGRRRELVQVAGAEVGTPPIAYPLVTWASQNTMAQYKEPGWDARIEVGLRAEPILESEVLECLAERAQAGEHVLWIRNTVAEAQEAHRALRGFLCESEVRVGLLHSRFPFTRRAELEKTWLNRLGPSRPEVGPGSILIATQVVEQSVDIDLDFIVSDLAPTDMLLQRMGRLWRHTRARRQAAAPEFWIRLPRFAETSSARELKHLLARTGKVYAPYVLLRSATVFSGRKTLVLPDDIRAVLEATYADPAPDEPAAWQELRGELESEKRQLAANAEAAMRVFGLPMLDTEHEGALTRRKGPPTIPVVIVQSAGQSSERGLWSIVTLDNQAHTVSEFEWRLPSARVLHQWLIRIPRWMVPQDAPTPPWLALYFPGNTTYACLAENGQLIFGDNPSAASYHEDFGVFAEKRTPIKAQPQPWSETDDEFDS